MEDVASKSTRIHWEVELRSKEGGWRPFVRAFSEEEGINYARAASREKTEVRLFEVKVSTERRLVRIPDAS